MSAHHKFPTANAQGVTTDDYADLVEHVAHLINAIDRGYFTDKLLATSAYITPLRAYAKLGVAA